MQLLGDDDTSRREVQHSTVVPAVPSTSAAPGTMTSAAAADAEGNEFGKLFVGGLSQVTNECSLRAYFGQYGPVEDAVVMMDNQTGRSRGFGFVKFKDTARVVAVLETGSGHVIDGKPVDVKQSNINVKGKTSRNLKVFVGGIAPEHDAEVVREFFSQYGRVTDVNLMLDQSKQRHRGFAFVAFDDERTVQHLVQLHFVDIGGRVVEIKAMKPPNFEARAAAVAGAAVAVSNHSSTEPVYRADFAAAGAAAAAAAAAAAVAYPSIPPSFPTAAAWPHSTFPCDPAAGFGWPGGTLAWPGYYGQPAGASAPVGLLETWPAHSLAPPLPPPPPPTASAWAPAGWLPQALVAWPGATQPQPQPQQQQQQQQQEQQLQSAWTSLLPPAPPQQIAPPQPPVIQSLGCWDQSLHSLTSSTASQPSWPRQLPQPPPPPYQATATDAANPECVDNRPGSERHLAAGSPLLLPRQRRRAATSRGEPPGTDSTGFSWLYPKDPPASAALNSAASAPAQSLSHVAAGDFDRCDASDDVGIGFARNL